MSNSNKVSDFIKGVTQLTACKFCSYDKMLPFYPKFAKLFVWLKFHGLVCSYMYFLKVMYVLYFRGNLVQIDVTLYNIKKSCSYS